MDRLGPDLTDEFAAHIAKGAWDIGFQMKGPIFDSASGISF